jgi:hypothetical protein
MGALAVDGRKFAGGHQAAAQEALFVFAVKQDDFHGKILVLPEQHADFGMSRALVQAESLPVDAMFAQGVEGLIEAGKEVFLEMVEFEEGRLVGLAENLAFTFDDGQEFLAQGEVPAKVRGDLPGRDQGVAAAPAGGLLVALRS